MKKEKRDVPLRTAYSQAGRLWQPKPSSLRAQAQLSETKTETMRTETVETFELVKVEPKLLREEKGETQRCRLPLDVFICVFFRIDLEFEVNEDDIEELIIAHEDELTIEELQEILNEEHQETQ
ncbi:hypothetical protein TNCV_4247281 [Trichonephila clavipes]|nr:hypothetical protein TNCV_4247281 [Trichonephila clavipes]